MRHLTILSLIAVATLAAAPLSSATQTQPRGEKTPKGKNAALFEKLGGLEGITAVVSDFVSRVGADNRINARFAKTDLTRLKKQLTDQICQLAGGPCAYTGADMLTVHKGMAISNDDFKAMMEDLLAALRHAGVSPKDEGALMGRLLAMKADIVERP